MATSLVTFSLPSTSDTNPSTSTPPSSTSFPSTPPPSTTFKYLVSPTIKPQSTTTTSFTTPSYPSTPGYSYNGGNHSSTPIVFFALIGLLLGLCVALMSWCCWHGHNYGSPWKRGKQNGRQEEGDEVAAVGALRDIRGEQVVAVGSGAKGPERGEVHPVRMSHEGFYAPPARTLTRGMPAEGFYAPQPSQRDV